MQHEDKTKTLEVKLESINPKGTVVKSQELLIPINNDRLFIHIGECLYRIDNKGFIIERVVPKDGLK